MHRPAIKLLHCNAPARITPENSRKGNPALQRDLPLSMSTANSYAENYPLYTSAAPGNRNASAKPDVKARSYFQGLAAGILGGAVIAILLPRLFRESNLSADELLRAEPESLQTGFDFVSRRENPESFGDPATLSGESSPNRGIAFSRPGGAPGGKLDAEKLATPGQPGKHLSFTNAAEGVHMQNRALNLGKRR